MDDITIHMATPKIKDKLLIGQCIAIDINRSTSCIACNKIQPVNNKEEFVTCKNCKMTTLPGVFQAKLVSQMMIKTDQNKLENFTCFNNAIQSILTPKLCPTPHLIRIEGRWNEKNIFDHWSNENDCFKKHKDHFKISWKWSILVWLRALTICRNWLAGLVRP